MTREGSGNFLTETYISLRKLENKIIEEKIRKKDVVSISFIDGTSEELKNPIRVNLDQFYGIEINDFAVTVARTALWISEDQMMKETMDIIHQDMNILPLKTYANIVEGNALTMDWNDLVDKNELDYIMGNPPFVGARLMNNEQNKDIRLVFGEKFKNVGNLDFVSAWYKKSCEYIDGTNIEVALVSTNSICQGEQVAILWKDLFENYKIRINFTYQTFRWDSEATMKAQVHCVIVGFGQVERDKKFIYTKDNNPILSKNINAYLVDGPDVFIDSRRKPLCDVPEMGIGNKPIDDGNYLFKEKEYEIFIKEEPASKKYFKLWYGSYEFINRKPRYVLWLGDCEPGELRKMPRVMERVKNVKEFRLASKSAGTRKIADTPTRYHVENIPKSDFLFIPRVSSERRKYIPIGFMTKDMMASDSALIMQDVDLYHFGILTSNVHMSWMRTVAGRLKSDYRYSKNVVYNNFPWPDLDDYHKKRIEKSAQMILDARALYPSSSLADLYDDLLMPKELRKAHQENDARVMRAYGFDFKTMTESECVAELMKMYEKLVNGDVK